MMSTTLSSRATRPAVPAGGDSSCRASSRLSQVVAIHFDPAGGTPYWLKRQRELGIDARREIRVAADLVKLGPMDELALSNHPVEDFIPRSQRHRRAQCLIGETAGTLGKPKYAVHREDEFNAAFVKPFVAAAGRAGFPRELNWLFIGPSGPHIIGKAANACAHALGSPDCFTIDLDPRWAKKLPPGSFGWRRYVEHLDDQALAILSSQRIGVIFSTPVVLQSLGPRLGSEQREAIYGLHLGGLSVSAEQRAVFAQLFPNAVILSGYGNTLFGVMPELAHSTGSGFSYFPHGSRLVVRVVPSDGSDTQCCLSQDVEYGTRGQVVISRLDEMQFIANMMERDLAVRLPPPAWGAREGFVLDGLEDPQPIVTATVKPAVGLY